MANVQNLSKDKKLAANIKQKLDLLFCPYTENVDESWIPELVFTPGESRIRLLQWLLCKLDSKLNDVLDPQQAPPDSRMDSRIQRLLFVASTLGLCQNDDVDVIRGVKTGSRQVAFINNLIDLVSVVDSAETSMSVLGSQSGPSLEDQFVADCRLMNTISSQTTVDSLFPTDIRLLPPDIARQIELDRQDAARLIETDKSVAAPDEEKLIEEINKLAKDLERQNSMLAEVKKKHKSSSCDQSVTTKSALKQTLQLSLSEMDQLITSFGCCYDNEMRPWCGGLSVSTEASEAGQTPGAALGPTLKRVSGPLEQFDSLLNGVRSIRSSYRQLCSDLHRDIGRLRLDVERLANAQPGQGQDSQLALLCSTLYDAVDVLEQSVLRVESGRESVNASAVSSSIAGTLNASIATASIRL